MNQPENEGKERMIYQKKTRTADCDSSACISGEYPFSFEKKKSEAVPSQAIGPKKTSADAVKTAR